MATTAHQQPMKMILDNRRIAIREVADDVGISFGSCQVIFENVLGIQRAAAEIVPKLLHFEQKQRCMNIAQKMLTTCNDDPVLLKKVITGEESRVMTLKPKSNQPNGSVQKSQERKKHVKFGQM